MPCCKPTPKACVVCCVALFVILAVSVPVGIFVIAPKVVGAVIDHTQITLDNATVELLPQVVNGSSNVTRLDISFTMDVPHPWSAHIKGFPCTVKTNGTAMATFPHPAIDLGPGQNHFNFVLPFNILNITALVNVFGFKLLDQNLSDLQPWMMTDLEITGLIEVEAYKLSKSKHMFDKDLKCMLLTTAPTFTVIPMRCKHGTSWTGGNVTGNFNDKFSSASNVNELLM